MAEGFWAKALFDYVAVETTELSVVKGETLFIEEQNDSGWSLGKKGDDSGWLPSDYVERTAAPGGAEETKEVASPVESEPEPEEPAEEPEAELPPEPESAELPPEPEEEADVPPPPAKKSVSVVQQPKPVVQQPKPVAQKPAEVAQPKFGGRPAQASVSQAKPVAKTETSPAKPSWVKSEVSQPKPTPVAQKTEVAQPKPASTTPKKVKSPDDEKEIVIAMSVNRNFTVVLFDDGLLLLDQKKSTKLDTKTMDALTTCGEFQEVIDLANRSYTLAAPKFQQPEHYIYLNSGSQKQRIYIYGAPKPSGNRLEGGVGSKDGDLPPCVLQIYQRIQKLNSDFGSSATFTSPIALGPLLEGFPALSYS